MQVFCRLLLGEERGNTFVNLPGALLRAEAQLLLLAAVFFVAVCLALEVPPSYGFTYEAFSRAY